MQTSRTSHAVVPLAAALALGVLVCGGLASSGCGASYQAVYEGEVRFEHCHRLDLESKVPLTQRRECWREWTEFYTFGQSRDRIEYASRRLRELSEELRTPGSSTLLADAGPPAPPAVIAPAPTNPFAPPPAVQNHRGDASADADAAPEDAAAEASAHEDPSRQPPGQACLLRCGEAWNKCVGACSPDKLKTCKTTCDIRFRGCAGRCL